MIVGRASVQVRDLLWEMVCEKLNGGSGIMLFPMNNEQGFAIRSHGNTKKDLIDMEGLLLFREVLSPKDQVTVAKEERSRSVRNPPELDETDQESDIQTHK